MKAKFLYSLLAFASLSSGQAFAEIRLASSNPADGATVKSLSKIVTIWENEEGLWLEPDEYNAVALVKNSNGETVSKGYFELSWDYDDATEISLSPSVTEPGEYTVEIPDNVFFYITNTAATLHYTVGDGSGGGGDVTGDDVTFVKANPASGSELESISSIETYWLPATSMYLTYNTSVKPILVDDEGYQVATGRFVQDYNTNGHFTITYNPAISEPGNYEVVIPANSFKNEDNNKTLTSAELRLSYTVKAREIPTSLNFERAYPANNTELSALSDIKLYWLTGIDTFTVRDDVSAEITGPDNLSLSCPIVAGDDNNQFIVKINPEIAVKGEYTISIPANIFLNSNDEEVTTPALTLKYNVKPVKVAYEAELDSYTPDSATSFKEITTVWYCNAQDASISRDAIVSVTKDDDQVTTGSLSILSHDSENSLLTVLITLAEEINAVGDYAVTIPEYFLIDEDGDEIISQRQILSVTVAHEVVAISLNFAEKQLNVGDTFELVATVTPEDAADKSVTWSTSDANVVTVSESGLVEAIGLGQATITAMANDGSGVSATCDIIVTKTSAVENVGADAVIMSDVYTTSGILIKRNADADFISNLAKGIYIINVSGNTYKLVK